MADAKRDGNFVTTLLAVSSVDGVTPVTLYANPTTHRLLVDLAGGGSGTVQTISIASANGFAGSSDADPNNPTLTISTTITGILKGNGTAISAVTVGTGLNFDGTTLSATGTGTGDVVGPASATDNALARFDTATGKLLQNSTVIVGDAGDITTTIADTANVVGLTITQNDVTNGKAALLIQGAEANYADFDSYQIVHVSTSASDIGPLDSFYHNSPTPAANDVIGGQDFYANDSGANRDVYAYYNAQIVSPIATNETAKFRFFTRLNGTLAERFSIGESLNGVAVGDTVSSGILSSRGNQNLVLQTGNATTGSITIADGANADITIAPNGTGDVVIGNGATAGALRPNGDGNADLGDSTNFFENLYLNTSIIKNDIEINSSNGVLEIDYSNNSATGAGLELIHRSVSPAANDVVGAVYFTGFDTAVSLQRYAQITGVITDTTSASEDGKLTFGVVTAGTAADELELTGAALYPTTNNGLDLGTSSLLFNNTYTTAIELGAASDTTLSRSAAGVIAVEGVVIPSISSTNTLTNKRVTPRTGTTTSSATPTINTDNVDFYSLTAQTADITSFTTNLSGTPTDGQKLWIAITGTAARAITWGASFEASTVALPTTTVTTNRLDVGFVWNSVTNKWRCVASC